MQKISEQEFSTLCQGATILMESDSLPKVLETPSGDIIKIFPPRKSWIKTRLGLHGKRFVKNGNKLVKKGFSSVHVDQFYYCASLKSYVAIYQKLPGEEMRTLVSQGQTQLLPEVAVFMARLHEAGIYFRAVHLANLIKEDSGINMIDVSNIKFRRHALGVVARFRNLVHMMNERNDKQYYEEFGVAAFVDGYLKVSKLTPVRRHLLRGLILRHFEEV